MPSTNPDDGSDRRGTEQPAMALPAHRAASTPPARVGILGRLIGSDARRPWLIPLVVATALTVVAGVGLTWERDEANRDTSAPADGETTQPPPTTSAGYLDRTRGMYEQVADAVNAANDLEGISDAAAVAAAIEPEIAELVTSSASLDPLPGPAQSALLTKRSDFIHAVGNFADLEDSTLTNFGDLAVTLGTAAQQLDQAETTYSLTDPSTSDHAAPADPLHADETIVLSSARPAAATEHTGAGAAAAHLTGIVGTVALSTTTANLTELVGDLEASQQTSDVRSAVADVDDLAAFATSARAGFPEGSTTAANLDSLAGLATSLSGLSTLDGTTLDDWDDTATALQTAAEALEGQLATASEAAYAHLDALVATARATIAAWEEEVAAARANSADNAELETYADTTYAQIQSYSQLIRQMPQLSGSATATSQQSATLFRLKSGFESLVQSVAASSPGSMAGVHADIVALFEDGATLADAAEETARTSQECQAETPEEGEEGEETQRDEETPSAAPTTEPTQPTIDPADCTLGAQPTWSAYDSANGPARNNATVQSQWETTLANARDAIAEQIAPPRPEV